MSKQTQSRRRIPWDVLFNAACAAVGAALLAYGAFLVYSPSGYIVLGLCILGGVYRGVRA